MYNPQLDTFLRVADAGSFNKAAKEAYITPTAAIKQINLLEGELDVKLFERTHRGLTLTKAGKSLYQDTKYIIQYCRDSVTRAKNAMQDDENIIRIGTSATTPAGISLAWMLCKKPYIVPIPGTRNADRLGENAGAAEVTLTKDEVKKLDIALDALEMSEVFGGSRICKRK